MMENIIRYLPWLYLAAISLIAFVVTCYDKIAAKKFPKHRSFMIGIPMIIIAQAAIIYAIFYFL